MHYKNVENIHITNDEALEKIKTITGKHKVCMMYTDLNDFPFTGFPMTVLDVDDDGVIWFYSELTSKKNDDIRSDSRMMLSFMEVGSYKFMSLYGNAFISTDREKIKSLWSPITNAWFDGKDDEHIALIGFKIEHGEFQESKDNSVLVAAKLTMSALLNTDHTPNAVKGTIRVG